MAKDTKLVGINDKGYRLGFDHQNAKLTDDDVELIRELRFEYELSYEAIVAKFDDGVTVSKSQVRNICQFRSRAQVPLRWKRVRIKP